MLPPSGILMTEVKNVDAPIHQKNTKVKTDFQGRKPIHISAGYGHLAVVQELLMVISLHACVPRNSIKYGFRQFAHDT